MRFSWSPVATELRLLLGDFLLVRLFVEAAPSIGGNSTALSADLSVVVQVSKLGCSKAKHQNNLRQNDITVPRRNSSTELRKNDFLVSLCFPQTRAAGPQKCVPLHELRWLALLTAPSTSTTVTPAAVGLRSAVLLGHYSTVKVTSDFVVVPVGLLGRQTDSRTLSGPGPRTETLPLDSDRKQYRMAANASPASPSKGGDVDLTEAELLQLRAPVLVEIIIELREVKNEL